MQPLVSNARFEQEMREVRSNVQAPLLLLHACAPSACTFSCSTNLHPLNMCAASAGRHRVMTKFDVATRPKMQHCFACVFWARGKRRRFSRRRTPQELDQSPGARGGGGLSPDVAACPLDRTTARELVARGAYDTDFQSRFLVRFLTICVIGRLPRVFPRKICDRT